MYRLRHMDVDDKVCEQVDLALLARVYPKEEIERCVGQSQPWVSKARRVRQSTLLALVWFVIGLALWSRLSQRLVWDKLVGKLSLLHPGEPRSRLSASGLSGRRQELGSQGLQGLLHECCQVLAQPQQMPSAFFGRYRLMAIDGTVFSTADTAANDAAFGRSSNQYGPGAYPQVRCVLLAECGSHAVVELEIDRYDVSEVHGAHRVVEEVGPDMLVLVDAGITSGGFFEHVRERRAHVLLALEAGAWDRLPRQRRLADGSVLAWVPPTRGVHYPMQRGMWVRLLSYRVTDERLGKVGQVYRLVTTLLNPRLAPALELIELYHERWEIELELYGIFLAHYAVRVLLAEAAVEAELDPDRLSFTQGLFVLTEMLDLALILEPEEATEPLLRQMRQQMAQGILPPRRLRVNRREVKQVYNKYKPKKRHLPPSQPFEPHEQFLDFVVVLDSLTSLATAEGGT